MDVVLSLLPKLGDEIEVLRGHLAEIYGLTSTDSVATDDPGFASNSWDGSVQTWKLNSSCQFKMSSPANKMSKPALCLAYIDSTGIALSGAHQCRILASGRFDGAISLHNITRWPAHPAIRS